MKLKIALIPIILVLALLSLPITGCSQVKNGQLVKIMKVLPDATTIFFYVDVGTLKADAELSELYEGFDSVFSSGEMSERGISLQDDWMMALAVGRNFELMVIEGRINLKDFRSALDDQGLVAEEYEGIEIWNGDYSVAFMGDMVIMAETLDSVKVPIRLAKEKDNSMYDNADMKRIAQGLPPGFFSIITSEVIDPSYREYTTVGISIKKSLKDTLEVVGWFKFPSAKKAGAEMSRLEDRVEKQFDAVKVNSRQYGELVKVTGEVSISDFARSIFWRYFFPKY